MGRRSNAAIAAQAALDASNASKSEQSASSEEVAASVEIPSFVQEPEKEVKVRQPKKEKVEKVDPAEDEPVVTIRRNEPRRRAVEEIEAREARERGDKVEAQPETEKPPKVEKAAAVEPKPDVKPDETVSTETTDTDETVETIDIQSDIQGPKVVKVKVDGQEFEVPESDIEEAGGIKAYQKDKAAENRLTKANQALAETRQFQALIAQQMQRNAAPPQPQITPDQFIASKMEKLRFGTEEESAMAMREILQMQKVDVNAITSNAVMTMQKNMAVDNFKKEFQDVVANPLLLRLASSLENERVAKLGPQADWNTFYRSIGNEVRSVTGRQSQVATTTPKSLTSDHISQPTSEKEARKASIVNIPTAAARATVAEAKPETREDLLNQMRKARGLPVG